MTNPTGASLAEDLTELPVAEAVRIVLERAVAAGMAEQDALDEAFGMITGRTVDLDGPAKTAARLLMVAKVLTDGAPQGVKPN